MTFHSPIFRKLIFTGCLVVAVTLALVGLYLGRGWLLECSLVAAAGGLALASVYSWWLARRIDRLRAFAESVVDARPVEAPLVAGEDDELGLLARSLEGMAARLRRLVARANLESAEREAILASMVEGVLAVDEKLQITFSNWAFAEVLGTATFVSDRAPLQEIVRDPALSNLLQEVLREGETLQRRLALVVTGGEERTFEVQAAPLASAAGPARRGAIAILHDVTHLERLERVRRDFVANVSHELRTPLTAIRGYAETLLDGGLEDRENSRHFVEIIKTHAIRLGNITSDLLTLSELESGRPGPPPERISIPAVVESSLRTVGSAARLAGVRLVRGEVEEAEVLGNRTHLEQVLVNLLDNGVKFNRAEGEVRIESRRGPNGCVTIKVEDTGIGIPSEHLPRIFQRFYRVDKARSREAGGTGLGLAIVKHIVERLNGTVTAESELGAGSKFTITLPAG
jgi:two-component system, OmpR family, phosphate regulon sensor histidine kinase PhoR